MAISSYLPTELTSLQCYNMSFFGRMGVIFALAKIVLIFVETHGVLFLAILLPSLLSIISLEKGVKVGVNVVGVILSHQRVIMNQSVLCIVNYILVINNLLKMY